MKNITAQYQLLKEGKMSKDAFVRSARMSFPQYISPVTSFKDTVSILKGKRLISETESTQINEATTNSGYTYIQEKPSVPEIDLVNPYQLKKGMEFELSKMSDLSGDAYLVAVDKAVKAIMKDKDKYKDLQIANHKEIKKADEELKMTEVGKNKKTKAKTDSAGYIKKPVKKDEAANVSVKKEDKKGKPKGVKEMTNKPKSAPGISKTMELPGKEKVLKALKEHLNKKKAELNEDMHHEYTHGMEVHTPSGVGKVSEIMGSTITVEFDNGKAQDFQVNILNKQKEAIKNAPQMEVSQEEPKKGITKEQVMNKLKEFFSKKKKIKELDIVTAQNDKGETTTVTTTPTGQGKRKAAQLNQQGVRTAKSQTLK